MAVASITFLYRHAEPNPCAHFGPRLDSQVAAHQQGTLAHAPEAQPAARLVERESAPVVGDRELDVAVVATEADRARSRRRRAARRSRAPPGPRGRRRAARRRTGRRSRPPTRSWPGSRSDRSSSSTLPARAAFRPEVVERRRAELARQREQLLHRLVGEGLGLLELVRQLVPASLARMASRRSRSPVSDWLTSSWRSRAMRARSSSWAASAALEVRRRSVSRRSSMRRNAWWRRSHLLGAAELARLGEVGAGAGEVGPLHLVHEPLERAEPPLQEEDVDEDREGDGEAQDQRRLGLGREVDARDSRRRSPRPRRRRSAAGSRSGPASSGCCCAASPH